MSCEINNKLRLCLYFSLSHSHATVYYCRTYYLRAEASVGSGWQYAGAHFQTRVQRRNALRFQKKPVCTQATCHTVICMYEGIHISCNSSSSSTSVSGVARSRRASTSHSLLCTVAPSAHLIYSYECGGRSRRPFIQDFEYSAFLAPPAPPPFPPPHHSCIINLLGKNIGPLLVCPREKHRPRRKSSSRSAMLQVHYVR